MRLSLRTSTRPALALLCCAALLVGCGTDDTAAGPNIGGGGGATDAGGTAKDASVTKDAGATPGDTGGGGGLCGDGTCDPAESQTTCPIDCKGGGGGDDGCLGKQCGKHLVACEKDAGCAAFLACAKGCDGLACVQGCVQKGGEPSQATKRVLQCGSANKCFDAPPKPVCGDGKCQDSESAISCPKDCAAKPVCGNGKCEDGEGPETCPLDCSGPKPVCGDGKCTKPENAKNCPKDCAETEGSCVGKCGQFQGEGKCQCDKQCQQFGDCCADYSKVCGGGGPVCGDGKCEPGEGKSCPKDCGGPSDDYLSCAKSKCGKQFEKCLSDKACASAVSCMAQCKPGDAGCIKSCAVSPDGSVSQLFQELRMCAQSQGCSTGGGPVCGDGKCEPGEDKTCPKDCAPPKPVCGNGKCEQGENAFLCPKDCASKPVCGDGQCTGNENQLTCPKDCGSVQDIISCAKSKCSKQYNTCAKDKACSKALDCMAKCKSTSCLQQCAFQNQGSWQTFAPVAQCAQQKGCLSGGGNQPVCGNGQCESGEQQTCPKDCGPPKPVCGNGQCEPGEQQSCPKDCQPQTKCGDGKCQFPQEDSKSCPKDCPADALTCKGACGGQAKGGCWCDNVCEQAGDCCADKVKICGGNQAKCGDGKCDQGEQQTCPKDCQPQAKCGDGVCNANAGENAKTCPKDCASSGDKPCKSKSDCTDAEVCCGKSNGNFCVPAGKCF